MSTRSSLSSLPKRRQSKRNRSASPEGASSSDVWEIRKKPVTRHPSPRSEGSPSSVRFPSPWGPSHFGSTTSSPALSHVSSLPSTAQSLPDDVTHSHLLRLPLDISHTIRLPEKHLVLPGVKDASSVTVRVPLWVRDYAESLVSDIANWKQVYDLTDLPSLLSDAEDIVFAHSDDSSKDLTAETLITDYHRPLNSCLSTLRDAFTTSEKFAERLAVLAEALPSPYFTYHLRSLSIIQQERLAICWALNSIVAPMAHWLGRPSSLLNELSNAMITPARNGYRFDILNKKSVDTLIPGNWVDDNIINYFSGNVKGSHHIILGDEQEVLFCSPLFWSIMSQANSLKTVGLNGQIFHLQSISKIQRILMPINVDQSHWILAFVNVKDGTIQIFDSFISPPSPTPDSQNKRMWLPPSRHGRDYGKEIELTKRWVTFLKDRYSLSWKKKKSPWIVEAPAPIQGNSHDCGLYVVMFVRHLTSGFTLNHAGLPKEMMIGKLWISLTTARLRFWMELPKDSEDWGDAPQFLRQFSTYRPYSRMILPGLPGA
ncbi:hypothetical protein ONZ45_g13168 [Pleurotus djamor]|nr:hypothetical protein ONZ45_g13168 [Pleurotus djamor]